MNHNGTMTVDIITMMIWLSMLPSSRQFRLFDFRFLLNLPGNSISSIQSNELKIEMIDRFYTK